MEFIENDLFMYFGETLVFLKTVSLMDMGVIYFIVYSKNKG